jgi:hypothetical protein
MRHTRAASVAIAAAIAATLTACGGGSTASTGTATTTPHPGSLAARIDGCRGYAATETSYFAREEGQCSLRDGQTADIATFADQANEDNYLKVAQSFGGVYVTGDRWIVQVDSQADAQQIQQALGGTIH